MLQQNEQLIITRNYPQAKTILIIEDDVSIGLLLSLAFTYETPYRSILAPSGSQAHILLQSVTPDFILLDYQLPDTNGLDLYDELSRNENLAEVPVLMMSTSLPISAMRKRKLPGIKKPFDLDELLRTVESLLLRAW